MHRSQDRSGLNIFTNGQEDSGTDRETRDRQMENEAVPGQHKVRPHQIAEGDREAKGLLS